MRPELIILDDILPADYILPLPEAMIPDCTPVSARDVRMCPEGKEYNLMLPLADPCNTCGAFNMTVGDYMYLGECIHCSGVLK